MLIKCQTQEKILPVIAEVVQKLPAYHFIIAAVPWQPLSFYQSFFNGLPDNLRIETDKTYNVLQSADTAIVTSGTATLETALFNIPQIVVYKTSTITYTLAKSFAKVKHISLPNLILDKAVIKELIQSDCTAPNIIREVEKLFEDDARNEILNSYGILHRKLGDKGASQRVAAAIYEDVKTNMS